MDNDPPGGGDTNMSTRKKPAKKDLAHSVVEHSMPRMLRWHKCQFFAKNLFDSFIDGDDLDKYIDEQRHYFASLIPPSGVVE